MGKIKTKKNAGVKSDKISESIDGNSLDIKKEKIEQLKKIIPEAFTESDMIDPDKLKKTLGEFVNEEDERYVLNWAGKSDAYKTLQKSSTATLAPDKKESVNFDTTENIFIEGENLEVLKVLQKSYFGKIKMIYIDPPYNTGNDSFIYPDKFEESKSDYLKRIGEKDEEGFLLKEGLFRKNSKENGQYHSNWLSMIYPRLFLARNLLKEDGVIFVSIDDNEVHNLRMVMNEIFGEENFIAQIVWEKRYGRSNDVKLMSSLTDYIILYRKSESLKILREPRTESNNSIYSNSDNDPRGIWTSVSFVSQRTKEERPNLSYNVQNPKTGELFSHPVNSWKYSFDKYVKLQKENRLYWGKDGNQKYPRIKRFLSELPDGLAPINLWKHSDVGTGEIGTREVDNLMGKEVFTFPKPTTLLKRILNLSTDQDSIILDFFAGSGSIAHSVLELNKEDGGNRKFILAQLPEKTEEDSEAYKAGYSTIADISKERIRRVIQKIEKEIKNEQLNLDKEQNKDFDLGFKVFKLKHSNFKLWRGDELENEKDLSKQLDAFEDPVKKDSDDVNIVYELMLKMGLDLNAKIETIVDCYDSDLTGDMKKDDNLLFGNFTYSIIDDGKLIIFTKADGNLKALVKEFLKKYKPEKVICLDRIFEGNDEQKTNLVLQMKDAGVEFRTV